ncbi:C4-dicarboxylate transport sensor protein DctB [Roseovarius sp. THAF27]|uniref:sensor histidine kinase n=1 Tax=Roseovarius sp. THAF27 TaxID=2587850 RepID=UPI00126978B4|nr:ATP-binding protein [Roseovarius sp. THAF27]QFT79754.1 C4-dicarboxylate transport sensor protein DctB [Roseovarius sp. THAF27]
MLSLLRARWLVIVLFLLAVAAAAGGVWRYGYSQGLTQLAKQGRADLALAADRFTGEMRRYRELAVLMSDHPTLAALTGAGRDLPAATRLLQAAVDKSGAAGLIFTDATGAVLAQAGAVTLNPQGSAYFRRAMQGALGSFFGRLGPEGRRVYAYAAPSFSGAGAIRGSLIVVVDISEIEWGWIGGQPVVFFTDIDGRVFLSNRAEIIGWRLSPGSVGLVSPDSDAPVGAPERRLAEIWDLSQGAYLPERALHLASPKPVIGMTGHALMDVAAAARVANLQAAVFAAICLAFGAVLLLLAERRRTLSIANAQLETRVADRTAELSQANAALRREVAERKEAEAALTRAQEELVQAGKLNALGQMSAGISHELNQPLMAIQQFADNGAAFLDAGKTRPARANMTRIADLAARAARIIKNLRAFARNEAEPAGKVDLGAVIDTAVELTEQRLAQENVSLDWRRPAISVHVRAGEVRLGQVFVNLINNAVDAMAGQARKRIEISLVPGARPTVTVRDTGPGISDPAKIFEPFYTTKEVGGEDGLGLGLSISYGLVESFGGRISGSNAPDGGAIFRIELDPWQEEVAA